MGKLIADIVKQPPHHLDQHYKQSSSNYTLIQATKWFISTPSREIGRGESRMRSMQQKTSEPLIEQSIL